MSGGFEAGGFVGLDDTALGCLVYGLVDSGQLLAGFFHLFSGNEFFKLFDHLAISIEPT